jgi:hypothetical protein
MPSEITAELPVDGAVNLAVQAPNRSDGGIDDFNRFTSMSSESARRRFPKASCNSNQKRAVLSKNELGILKHAFSYWDASLPGNFPVAEIVDFPSDLCYFFLRVFLKRS